MKQLSDEVLTQVRAAFVKAEDCIQAMTDGPHHGDWGDTLDVLEKALAALDAAQQAQPERAPSDDTARIDFMETHGKSNVFSIVDKWYTRPSYGQPYTKHKSLRDAIDAAIKQGGQHD